MRISPAILCVGLLATMAPRSNAFEYLTTLDLPDFNARALTVHQDTNRLVVHNCFAPAALHLIQPSYDSFTDRFEFDILAQQRNVNYGLGDYCDVFYDNGLLHYLSISRERTCEFCTDAASNWDRVFVVTVDGDLQFVDSYELNPLGDEPTFAPVDFRFNIGGVGFKPGGVDGRSETRMVIFDSIKGNLHIVDIAPGMFFGLEYAAEQFDIRARWETTCQWPDIDPGQTFYTCSGRGVEGNQVGLDYTATLDRVFIADQYQREQPWFELDTGLPSNPVTQPPVDVLSVPISSVGIKSVYPVIGQSRSLWPTRTQSFDEGAIVELDHDALLPRAIGFTGGSDLGAVIHDPREANRFFLPTADRFATDPPMILREFVNNVVVRTLNVPIAFSTSDIPTLALDPAFGLLYIGVDNQIAVVRLNASGPFPNPQRDDQAVNPLGGTSSGHRYGSAVAVTDGFLFAGAPGDGNGSVFIFRRQGGSYVFFQEISAPPGLQHFGHALATAGGRVIVGAPAGINAKGGTLGGAILERLGQGWQVKQTLTSTSTAPGLGTSVAIDGDTVVLGAPMAASGGAVFAFAASGGSFSQVASTSTSTIATPGARFGYALALKRGRLAVGAPASTLNAVSSGATALFEMVGSNLRQLAVATGNASDGDAVGTSVALSGDVLLAGAPGRTVQGQAGAGAVFRFEFDGAALQSRGELTAGQSEPGAAFGASIAADDRFALIGASGASRVGAPGATGSAFLFADPTGNPRLIERLDPGSATMDDVGAAVGFAGDVLVLGAPATSADAGQAAVFFYPDSLHVSGFEG